MNRNLLGEDQLLEARRAAIGHLRIKFPELRSEHEDIAQGAVEALLERRRRDQLVRHPSALARDIAAKRAIDLLRRSSHRNAPLSAASGHAARAPEPERIVESRSVLSSGLLALEEFPLAWRQLYRRAKLDGEPVCALAERYGISKRAVQKRLNKMQAAVNGAAGLAEASSVSRAQFATLSALAARSGEFADERRAGHVLRLVKSDAKLTAVFRDLCEPHRGVATAIAPLAFDEPQRNGWLGSLLALPGRLRDFATGIVTRLETGDLTGGVALSGETIAGGGGGATGGVVAKLGFGAGGLGLSYVGGGAVTACCVTAALLTVPLPLSQSEATADARPPATAATPIRELPPALFAEQPNDPASGKLSGISMHEPRRAADEPLDSIRRPSMRPDEPRVDRVIVVTPATAIAGPTPAVEPAPPAATTAEPPAAEPPAESSPEPGPAPTTEPAPDDSSAEATPAATTAEPEPESATTASEVAVEPQSQPGSVEPSSAGTT